MVCPDDGEAAFLFLSEEPHSERSCEMSFFFFAEGKVIEMSEKEPGSLEKQGSLKCQRSCSSSNVLLFTDSPGCGGLS